MISIKKCRELIPDSDELTDEEIEDIRWRLYGLAELALDCYFEDLKKKKHEVDDKS